MAVNSYMLGAGIGVLAGLFFYFIFWLAGRGGCSQKYDERQLAAQGSAAKAAFYTGMAYSAGCDEPFHRGDDAACYRHGARQAGAEQEAGCAQ